MRDSIFGTYYLLKYDIPVTEIMILLDNDGAELRYQTFPKYRRKVYAITANQYAEDLIYNSDNCKHIHLIGITEYKITTSIAIKLGYKTWSRFL